MAFIVMVFVVIVGGGLVYIISLYLKAVARIKELILERDSMIARYEPVIQRAILEPEPEPNTPPEPEPEPEPGRETGADGEKVSDAAPVVPVKKVRPPGRTKKSKKTGKRGVKNES